MLRAHGWARAVNVQAQTASKGVYASAIVFPTVPRGTGRIRAMVSAAHSKDQLERAVQAFKKVRDKVKF